MCDRFNTVDGWMGGVAAAMAAAAHEHPTCRSRRR